MQPPPSFGGCGGPGLKGGKFDKSFGGKGKGKGKGKGWGPGVGFVPGGCLGFAPAGGGGGCSGGTSNSFSKASGGAPRIDGAPAPLLVPPPGGAPHPGAPPTSGPFNQMGIAGVAPAKRRAPQSSGDDPAKRVRGDAGLAGFFGTAPLPGAEVERRRRGRCRGRPCGGPRASPAEPAGACTPRGLLSSLPAPFDVEYDEFGEPVSGGVGDGAAEAEAGAAGAAGETGPEDVGVEAAGDEAAGDEAAADEGAGAAEGDEHEGEESCEAPPPKTPRIASLLAGLPAPVDAGSYAGGHGGYGGAARYVTLPPASGAASRGISPTPTSHGALAPARAESPMPSPEVGGAVDGKQFFRQARRVLSNEAFDSFLTSIKRLNSQLQTREETLAEASRLFGAQHQDLAQDAPHERTRSDSPRPPGAARRAGCESHPGPRHDVGGRAHLQGSVPPHPCLPSCPFPVPACHHRLPLLGQERGTPALSLPDAVSSDQEELT
ncbi:unnamed protein product [Prorocentrum cordatum]|uniref:At4g15545-like C-terminal domain-containing protein n=1 Tax=Prorocentrum cordatum TaxID=2364126 RepID=A0ABN9T4X0_9DINO|nr:unnamed protein product [Polarella glacialis]